MAGRKKNYLCFVLFHLDIALKSILSKKRMVNYRAGQYMNIIINTRLDFEYSVFVFPGFKGLDSVK